MPQDCDDGNEIAGDACNLDCTDNCGNGVLNEGEVCDDGDDNEEDACTSRCAPPTCGDGLLQKKFGEECDDGDGNSYKGSCTGFCKQNRCGDGFVGPLEHCDPGDNAETPDCDFDCEKPMCGDNKLNEAAGEDCEGPGPYTNAMCLTCQFACATGWGNCTHDDLDPQGADKGCETDIRVSAAHCGQCNKPCDGTCSDGACMAP